MKLAIRFFTDFLGNTAPYWQRHIRAAVEAAKDAGITLVKPEEDPDHVYILNNGMYVQEHVELTPWLNAFDTGSGIVRGHCREGVVISSTATTHPKTANLVDLIDKWSQHQKADAAGITVPETILINHGSEYSTVSAAIGSTAFIMKPRYGYGGLGLSLVRSEADFLPRDNYIAQQIIGKPGTHYQVAMVEDTVVSVIKRVSPDPSSINAVSRVSVYPAYVDPLGLSPENRISMTLLNVSNVTPVPSGITSMISAVTSTFDVDIAGVDILEANNGDFYFNEINFDSSFVSHMNVSGTNPYATYMEVLKLRFPE